MDDGRDRWSTSIVLSDGDTAYLRAITPRDAPALLAFHERQPSDNLYRRFLSPKPTLSAKELEHFTNVDFHDRVALVAEHRGEFIAWASYERWKARDDAEVAFLVDDAHQGRGIATLLLEHLASIARSNGIERFTAEALSDNRAMLRVFSRAGWPVERHYDSGLTEVEFSLTQTEQFVDSVEAREHRADSRAVARLLLPRSMAVIGASDRPETVGYELWRNTVAGFDGQVYPVNRRHDTVGGRRSYAAVTDIVDDVSLAILAIPAEQLAETIESCIAKRVRGAVIISATEGTDVDMSAIVANARRNGLRIIGPASMGIASPRKPGGIQAALVGGSLPAGGVAISMQSGSLGASVLQSAARLSIGISWFVSLGDKCDVSGNDLIQFWEDDDNTSVIAIYTESFGNPRKFARIARRVGRTRPIVAVRTGTAAIGNAADALYQQAGLIEVPTVRAMLDTARVLATQPVPAGPSVAILTNARSPGILANAAVVAAGLIPVEPPILLDWRSSPNDFGKAITAAIASAAVDSIMVIYAPPLATARPPATEIEAATAGNTKPVVAVMLGGEDGMLLRGSRVCAFAFPEPAAAVLGRMYAYSRWRSTEAESTIEPVEGVDSAAVNEILTTAIERGDLSLGFADAHRLFAAYGLTSPDGVLAVGSTADDIVDMADALGYPVVVKAVRRRVGRSARAGIALDLADEHAVRKALTVIRSALGDDADALVVQQMAQPGVDVRISCTTDVLLGPVITVELGSQQTPGHGDAVSRLAPVSRAAAKALVHTSRTGDALAAAGLGDDELVDAIVRVAQLMFDHAEIGAIDLDPLIVSDGVCVLTDATVEVRRNDQSDFPLRRLG